MVGLASFGTMSAMLSCGARIAGERAVGWNRQLRISPLSPRAYFRAKVVTATRWRCSASRCSTRRAHRSASACRRGEWFEMTGLILVGLIPFAALGITLGHMLTPDSIGPAMGGGVSLLALLGGTWFPLGTTASCTTWRSSPVLLARAGQSRGARRSGVGRHGLGGDRRLDGRVQRAGAARLQARHGPRVAPRDADA